MLHHDTLTAPGAAPDRWVLFCHGILGRGSNWRGFARALVRELPTWGAVLVDLRAHGASRAVPPPDSIEAAARDLHALVDERPVRAVLGHSFGGKVALELSRQRAFDQLFVVDSLPGARPGREGAENTERVVKMLGTLPAHFLDREAFHRYVQELGFTRELAAWLGQNLDAIEGGGYELGLDVPRIEALLGDYFVRDLWPALDPPPAATTAHLVIAGRSTVYGDADRERARDLAARHERVRVHVLERADHWVHIDDPDGLLAIASEALS
ncbi:MAG: alpha/beta hydrolase [Sandaracinaceae bacterium]|nr:alpha/beta hydrolase [Sandaracinaceae bacterium]